jgi:hypothetical protein
MRAVAIKKGQSREKQWVFVKWERSGVMAAARSSSSFIIPRSRISGSLKKQARWLEKVLAEEHERALGVGLLIAPARGEET